MAFDIHIGPNIRTSPYFDATVADGVRSFSVYNHMFIPGNFGDPEAEYERLVNGVAMWDVGAQRQVEISGPDAATLVRYLVTRDLGAIVPGKGRYVPLCRYDGTLINDPVLLPLAEDRFWLSIADSDIALWAEAVGHERGLNVRVEEPDVSPLAIQGPKAADVVSDLLGGWVRDLGYFHFRSAQLDGIDLIVARSGWSKQGGFELYLTESSRGSDLWAKVKEAGKPHGIGPGAPNDIERIESGLVSYGADGRYQTVPVNPYEIGLGKLVSLDRTDDFIGRTALQAIHDAGPKRHRIGLFLDGPPVTTNAQPVPLTLKGKTVGTVSEVTYSSRLGRSIGLAIADVSIDESAQGLQVDLGQGPRPAIVTQLPFIA